MQIWRRIPDDGASQKNRRENLHVSISKSAILATALLLSLSTVSKAGPLTLYGLKNTLSLPTVDVKDIASDGSNLLVIGNMDPSDTIGIYTTAGQMLSTYQAPGLRLAGLAWTGSDATGLATGNDPNFLYRIDLPSGPSSGPQPIGPFLAPTGIGFDGTNLLVSEYSDNAGGVVTVTLHEFDPASYSNVGTESLIINSGSGAGPVYDFAVHNGDIFLGIIGFDYVYEFSGGDLVQSILIPTYSPQGIAFVGDDLFVGDRATRSIFELSPVTTPEAGTFWTLVLGGLAVVLVRLVAGRKRWTS